MRLHHLAALTALLTFVLMILGSLVHGTGSSLACPDWPLCHGTAFPTMTGGVEFEHTHRLVALSVALLCATLFAFSRRSADRRTRALGALLVVLVLVQAILGGLTVILRLPPAVSIAHLATSITVLSALLLFTIVSAPQPPAGESVASRPRTWIAIAAVAAFAQAILGAAVRHTGAALACQTLPLCDGSLWPDETLPRIHALHRLGALVVSGLVLAAAVSARAGAPRGSNVLRVALIPPAVVVVQVTLGVVVVWTGAPLNMVTLHHATGVLLVGSLVSLWGLLGRSDRAGGARGERLSDGAERAPKDLLGVAR